MIKTITLKDGRDKSLKRHHPWIFSKALDIIPDNVTSGDIVHVLDSTKNYLATGVFSKTSQIAIRVLSFRQDETIDYTFIQNRIKSAIALRTNVISRGNDGVRLVASEGDYLPGLIVDKYNDYLVISITSLAMEILRNHIIKALKEIFPKLSIYERSDGKARKKEGLKEQKGLIYGKDVDDIIFVREEDSIYIPIDIKNGHKTGGYLDQRASRKHLSTLTKGKSVLNCFCYTGGFGLWALKGGAKSVINVDVSSHALDCCKKGVVYNHLDPGRCKFLKEDVFAFLRDELEKGHTYDVIVLDPPKFVESQATLKSGCRGYQDINRLALSLIKKGGTLLTFSCSGLMDSALFQKIVADAALDANVNAQIITTLRQDSDHVVATNCPESFYLKGLEIRVN